MSLYISIEGQFTFGIISSIKSLSRICFPIFYLIELDFSIGNWTLLKFHWIRRPSNQEDLNLRTGYIIRRTLFRRSVREFLTSTILVIPLKPYRNYILSGDMFAISKQFFEELKFYDDGMRVWGGEQFELRKVFILLPGNPSDIEIWPSVFGSLPGVKPE